MCPQRAYGEKNSDIYCAKITQFFLINQQKIQHFIKFHLHSREMFILSFVYFLILLSITQSSSIFSRMYARLERSLANIPKMSQAERHSPRLNPNPEIRNKRATEKRESRKREERKISSWLLPTITNSSFPLRRHSHS